MKSAFLERMAEKVVVFDGAMGTSLMKADLGPDDFAGHEGLNEILVETRPEVVAEVHASFFEAGCDVVETDSFSSNAVVLAEFGLEDRAYDLSRKAAELARGVAADFSTPDQPRFVCGSIGPGTKLPTLGHIGFRALRSAFQAQVEGLLDGGVDALIVETCQDLLQIKAVLDAIRIAQEKNPRAVARMVSVTIERTGTMLVGADMAAAAAALRPMGIDSLGMNCATGPDTMKRHVAHLSEYGPERISAMPNAGLPVSENGQIVYPMGPSLFADWVEGFVREDGVGIVGGCCGTTPEHLRELVSRVGGLAAPQREAPRRAEAASLYQAIPLVQEPAPLLVGERMNANGSKAFRERLLADDYEAMLDVAREQERGGAHLLDLSVAYVGRDEMKDMETFVPMLAQTARLPLVIDSTTPAAIEAALERYGGRVLINSINLEDGPERLDEIVRLAKRFGAALIALVIDEEGMALTVERKLAVAERIYDRVVRHHGLSPSDLVFDMLTFTVGSGDPATKTAARETVEAVAQVKNRLPGVHTLLGVSNVSFGLKPAARKALNSVFLAMAVERGLDQAIVNPRGIVPLDRIPAEVEQICRRLVLADESQGDPLTALMDHFAGAKTRETKREKRVLPPAEDLTERVVEGRKKGIEDAVQRVLDEGREALAVINELLIPAMRTVGERFGEGRIQLPFVLQSAEAMKAAVRHLEPLIEKDREDARGTFVLATVKGDVHDIGKNLVDVILTNNGYRVVNLGIKVSVEEMLQAAKEHDADAIGMSGLLVKSTLIMRENLEEMVRRGVTTPVLLGGAALNRRYVEDDLGAIYGSRVHYCKDAFDALALLDTLHERTEEAPKKKRPPRKPRQASPAPPVTHEGPARVAPVPGRRVIDEVPLDEVLALLDCDSLYRGRWRYRRGKLSREDYAAFVRDELDPVRRRLEEQCRREAILKPQGVVGWYAARAEGEEVVLEGADGDGARLHFPRRAEAGGRSLADYVRPDGSDRVGLFVATVGPEASRRTNALYESDAYRDYLHLHGFSVESAEATAEWIHRRLRAEAGVPDGQGGRYSFGYPACPDLEQQRTIFRLLEPEHIGVQLSETLQMQPEQSVSAVVFLHPDSSY